MRNSLALMAVVRALLVGIAALAISATTESRPGTPTPRAQHPDACRDTLPFDRWVAAGKQKQIRWRVHLSPPFLHFSQQFGGSAVVEFQHKAVAHAGAAPEVFAFFRVLDKDGSKLADNLLPWAPGDVTRLPLDATVSVSTVLLLRPGDYRVVIILYDRVSGAYNLDEKRIRVKPIRSDPLAEVLRDLPKAEFEAGGLFPPQKMWAAEGGVAGGSSPMDRTYLYSSESLKPHYLPLSNRRPLRIHLIASFDTSREVGLRNSSPSPGHTRDVLRLISQLRPQSGSVAVSVLDLLNREVVVQRAPASSLDWLHLGDLSRRRNLTIDAEILSSLEESGAFFRDFVTNEAAPRAEESTPVSLPSGPSVEADSTPQPVYIFVRSSLRFRKGTKLFPMQLSGDCGCLAFDLRLGDYYRDEGDDLDNILEPLRPRRFFVTTPEELRKAVAEIVRDLSAQ